MSVQTDLSETKSAHQRYLQANRDADQAGVIAALQAAQAARASAHESDPLHQDSAWNGVMTTNPLGIATHAELHDSLTTFYVEQLARLNG